MVVKTIPCFKFACSDTIVYLFFRVYISIYLSFRIKVIIQYIWYRCCKELRACQNPTIHACQVASSGKVRGMCLRAQPRHFEHTFFSHRLAAWCNRRRSGRGSFPTASRMKFLRDIHRVLRVFLPKFCRHSTPRFYQSTQLVNTRTENPNEILV